MPNTPESRFVDNSQFPHSGIADMLLTAASRYSQCGVIVTVGGRAEDAEFVSYPSLLEEAQRILGGLNEYGRPAGAKIGLLLDGPREFIPAFWACILGGYVPCPLAHIRNDPGRWERHAAHVDSLLDHPLFICSDDLLSELTGSFASAALSDLRKGVRIESRPSVNSSSGALLMLTSGSTGNAKAVELTHRNLFASMRGRAQRQQLNSRDITFNWIAFDHVAALLESHMIALFVGATQIHALPATVISEPLLFLRIIDRHRVSVAFAPNFLLGQINLALQAATQGGDQAESLDLDLSCLRRIVTGGEANLVETGVRFLELLRPKGLQRSALWPAFGMTETCAASVYSHEFPEADMHREFASVGHPIDGLEMRVVDGNGVRCADGDAGELQLRGSMIFERYYNNQEATRAAFTVDNWFRTGDVGRIEGGRLSLVARNKDSIIVSGVNYYSQELESKLEQLQGVEKSFVAVFPTRPQGADTEQLVIAFATAYGVDQDAELYQLLIAIRNTTVLLWGFRPAAIVPLPMDRFPKTSLGKIQRTLMRTRFEAGEYNECLARVLELTRRQVGPHVPPEGSQERAVAEVFCRVLGMDLGELSATTSFFDSGGTSLDILKFTRALERRFGTRVGLPIVLQNATVRQLAHYVSAGGQRQGGEYDPIVPLQVSGKGIPLFCVHPGNGEVFVLTNVAKYFLNDRPFYAIRPRGFNDGEARFGSFAEMVDTYVNAIQKRQPEGPYVIAGYSLGCQIAFEVARELEKRGQRIGFLGCIDHWPAWEIRKLGFNMATGLALVTELITLEQFEHLKSELRPELPSDEDCDRVLRMASQRRLAELDLDSQRFAVWSRVAHTTETMLFGHVNRGVVDKMTIFCSDGIAPRYTVTRWTRQSWRTELARWNDLVRSPRYVDVPGDHHGLMGPKHVAVFQSRLRDEIDRALEEC